MTWTDFKKTLQDASLTQVDFARIIKANVTTVNKWRMLKKGVPGYAEVIVILLANDPRRIREL